MYGLCDMAVPNPYAPPNPSPHSKDWAKFLALAPMIGFVLGFSGVAGVIVSLLLFRYFGLTLGTVCR